MDLPAVLDVGLGLVVVFFLVASICSVLVELLAGRVQWRHTLLKGAVRRLLAEPEMEKRFWQHPEIEPLRAPDTESPGYLDGRRFAGAVLDLTTGGGADGVVPDTRNGFARAFDKHAPVGLRGRLNAFLRAIPPDTGSVRAKLSDALVKWYDEAMERTTGAYKRRVQKALFGIGLGTALLLNCDALRISYLLFRDAGLRNALVDYARTVVTETPGPADAGGGPTTNLTASAHADAGELRATLKVQIKELQAVERLGFPLGWVAPFAANFLPFQADARAGGAGWWTAAVALKIVGLLATALAVCLGAPFWFDVLNRLTQLRSSGAKSGGESVGPAQASDGTAPAAPVAPSGGAVVPSVARRPLPSLSEALRDPRTGFSAAKAAWLAEAALLAYAKPDEVEATIKSAWRLERVTSFEDTRTNTQGFLTIGSGIAVLAFRGTEPAQIPDWRTDAEAFLKAFPQAYLGKVHAGFANALDPLEQSRSAGALPSIYRRVAEAIAALPGSGSLLYITGHSLGAGLATLCAYRLAQTRVYPVQGVYTFGSPRVGDGDFAEAFARLMSIRVFRVVNNEDLVTRVPPRSAGYKHVGEMIYLDEEGRIQGDVGFWYRFLNLAANAADDFWKAARTTVRDHSMDLYCEQLKRAATTS